MTKIIFTEQEEKEIVNQYKNGVGSISIARKFNVSKTPILRVLKQNNVINFKKFNKKIILSEKQKTHIKKLYCDENRNAKYISKELGLTVPFINKYLQNVGYRKNKSEAMKICKTGKRLPISTILKMTESQRNLSESGKRKQTGGVCVFYKIGELRCQGSYEKFYIEKLIKDGVELPVNGEPVKTPYGVYTPDFKKNNRFIEIKSQYTYDVLIGRKKSRFTNKIETNQYDKLKWVNTNYLPVEIVVVDKIKNKLLKKTIDEFRHLRNG